MDIISCMHNIIIQFVLSTTLFNTCDISAVYFADFLWTCFSAVKQMSADQIKDLFLFFSRDNKRISRKLSLLLTFKI